MGPMIQAILKSLIQRRDAAAYAVVAEQSFGSRQKAPEPCKNASEGFCRHVMGYKRRFPSPWACALSGSS